MDQFYATIEENQIIVFMYKNWKGVLSKRKAVVIEFFFGKTSYHTNYQMFIKGFDLDKLEMRDFAVADISAIEVITIGGEQ